MKIVHHFEEIPKLKGPIALSIGVYDGVHLGHQTILNTVHKLTRKEGSSVLITFVNHPSTFFTPNNPVPLITSIDQRLSLLAKHSLDLVILLPFDRAIANQTYDAFFKYLRTYLPFDHLIIGEDARFGKDRQGGPEEIKAFSWHTQYLPKETYHKEVISSGTIRQELQKGNLKKVKKMLGRPYSLLLPFDKQNVIQDTHGQYKWVTGTEKLCLLPPAVYAVDLQTRGKPLPAIAFYRGTKTINGETKLSLTLYFEKEIPEGESIEITFIGHLHDELDPEGTSFYKPNLLETLKTELSV